MATCWSIKSNTGINRISVSVCVLNDVRRPYHVLYFSYMY